MVKNELHYQNRTQKFNQVTASWLNSDFYLIINFIRNHHYMPNLSSPKTMNENFLWILRKDRTPLRRIFADKIAAREYASKVIPDLKLPEVYGEFKTPEEIPFSELPDSFVVKATHGSGWVYLVPDRSQLDTDKLFHACKMWLSTDYSYQALEWFYRDLPPRLIVEEFLHDPKYEVPLDYKFFVSNGSVKIIQVDCSRFKDHKRNMYTPDWTLLPIDYGYRRAGDIEKPLQLNELIRIAERLGEAVNFVRVDLYIVKETIYFGELTNTPEAGQVYLPSPWDRKLGDMLSPI